MWNIFSCGDLRGMSSSFSRLTSKGTPDARPMRAAAMQATRDDMIVGVCRLQLEKTQNWSPGLAHRGRTPISDLIRVFPASLHFLRRQLTRGLVQLT